MKIILRMLLAATIVLVADRTGRAADGDACCVCRQKKCKVTVDTQEVGVECDDVRCEDVCIPPVRFWWERGPLKTSGKIRTVRKLVTKDVGKKTVCTYDWEVVTMCAECFAKVHRLRCNQLHVHDGTPPRQVGLPVPLADGTVTFELPKTEHTEFDESSSFAPIVVAERRTTESETR